MNNILQKKHYFLAIYSTSACYCSFCWKEIPLPFFKESNSGYFCTKLELQLHILLKEMIWSLQEKKLFKIHTLKYLLAINLEEPRKCIESLYHRMKMSLQSKPLLHSFLLLNHSLRQGPACTFPFSHSIPTHTHRDLTGTNLVTPNICYSPTFLEKRLINIIIILKYQQYLWKGITSLEKMRNTVREHKLSVHFITGQWMCRTGVQTTIWSKVLCSLYFDTTLNDVFCHPLKLWIYENINTSI